MIKSATFKKLSPFLAQRKSVRQNPDVGKPDEETFDDRLARARKYAEFYVINNGKKHRRPLMIKAALLDGTEERKGACQ